MNPPAIRNMLGAPLVIHETPSAFCTVRHDSQLPWVQTRPSVHYRQQQAAIFRVSLGRSRLANRLHTRAYPDRITYPICTLCLPILTLDLGTSFSPQFFRFPYRKRRWTEEL